MKTLLPLALLLSLLPTPQLTAADGSPAAALAAETEAHCATTAKAEPTAPDTVVAKVKEACAVLEKEGPAAFPKFSGRTSPFIFAGTYIWVHTLAESEMLLHPIKYKMVGNKLIGLKDSKGKRFFVVMNDLVREKGEGWVDYYWPKPNSTETVRKISYVRKCTMANGVTVVVGAGLYSYAEADVAKLDIH